MNDDTIASVAIGLVWWEVRLLVGARGPQGVLAGFAEFPGGKCLPGEAPEKAVVREVREETGINVVATPRLETEFNYSHGRLRLCFFDCLPLATRPFGDPKPPFRWVPVAGLDGLEFPPANRQVLASIAAHPGPLLDEPR